VIKEPHTYHLTLEDGFDEIRAFSVVLEGGLIVVRDFFDAPIVIIPSNRVERIERAEA
jgi:hypothetical protein